MKWWDYCSWWWCSENHSESQASDSSEYWRTFCLISEFIIRFCHQNSSDNHQEGVWVWVLSSHQLCEGGGTGIRWSSWDYRWSLLDLQLPAKPAYNDISKLGFQLVCDWRWRNKSWFFIHPGDTLIWIRNFVLSIFTVHKYTNTKF
jgi:hypothetical protein